MSYLLALLPTAEVMAQWEKIDAALLWAKVEKELLQKISEVLGEADIPGMTVLAALEVEDVQNAMVSLDLTTIKKTRINLLMNALKQKYGMPLLDFTKQQEKPAEVMQQTGFSVTALDAFIKAAQDKATGATGSTVAVAHVLDQTSTEQLALLPQADVDRLRQNLHTKLGGEPLESEAFTDAQLTAFKRRLDAGGSPACDYAILGPYGNRMERRMKFTATYRDAAGHERTLEVAGPDTIDTWESCHQVFKNLCLACDVSKSNTLDNYKSRFKERCAEFSGQWGLAMCAEATCRLELWPRLRSQHQRLHSQGDGSLSPFDLAMPWESAINASITDSDYWSRYFERKALKALVTSRVEHPIHAVPDDQPPQPYKIPRLGRKANKRDQAWISNTPGEAERRPDGRFYWDGRIKFCADYHLDNGCQQTCPQYLSHRCEFCLGWHRSLCCRQKPDGWTPPPQKGKGKGKGKAKGDKGGKKGGGSSSYRSW